MLKAWKYAVTFETPDTQPPYTVRGAVVAGSPAKAASTAVREASRARPGRRWRSLVVLLEKPSPAGEEPESGLG